MPPNIYCVALILSVRAQFVESRLSKVELGGVNGVKRGKSHQNLTAAQTVFIDFFFQICYSTFQQAAEAAFRSRSFIILTIINTLVRRGNSN